MDARAVGIFIRGNPPSFTSSATTLTLAHSAHHFFLAGEPEIADRYFPWLVNLLSKSIANAAPQANADTAVRASPFALAARGDADAS